MDSTGQILSRCGYRCDLCLAYAPNLQAHPENARVLSDGWHKYFGFRIQPEDIYCEGCLAESPRLIDSACPVRPCAIVRKQQNCATCAEYACDKLNDRLVTYEALLDKFGEGITDEDRTRFIKPYENKARLDAIRSESVRR